MQFFVSSHVRGGHQKSPAGYKTTTAALSEKSSHTSQWPSHQSSFDPTEECEDAADRINSHPHRHQIPRLPDRAAGGELHRIATPESSAIASATSSPLERPKSPHLRSQWMLLPLLVFLMSCDIVPVARLLPSGSASFAVDLAASTAALGTTQIFQRCLWLMLPMGLLLFALLLLAALRTHARSMAAGPGGTAAAALKTLPVLEALGAEAATAALPSTHLRPWETSDASAGTSTNTSTWQHCFSSSGCEGARAGGSHSNTDRVYASACEGAVSSDAPPRREPFYKASIIPTMPTTPRLVLAPEASTSSSALISCLSPSLSAAASSSKVTVAPVDAAGQTYSGKRAAQRGSGWCGACDVLSRSPPPGPSQTSTSPSTPRQAVLATHGSSKPLQRSALVAFISAPASVAHPLPCLGAASHRTRQPVARLELNLPPSLLEPSSSVPLTRPAAAGGEGMTAAAGDDHIKTLRRQHRPALLYTSHRPSYLLYFQVDSTAADNAGGGEAPRSSG